MNEEREIKLLKKQVRQLKKEILLKNESVDFITIGGITYELPNGGIPPNPGDKLIIDPDGDGLIWDDGFVFKMIVTSPLEPTLIDVVGGAITTTDNSDGTFTFSSEDTITSFKMDVNKEVVTEINILKGETLLDLEYAFNHCDLMTVFNWGRDINVINISNTWSHCAALLEFPLIDLNSVEDAYYAWFGCSSLTTFPLVDLSNALTVGYAWQYCSGLTSFPAINTSSVTDMNHSWQFCTELTSFPTIDTSNVTSMSGTWNGCTGLISFPAIDTSIVTNIISAWENCSNLVCISGTLDFSAAINFTDTFAGCNTLLNPASTGTPVRDGANALVGTWTNTNQCPSAYKLVIAVRSSTTPMWNTIEGGAIIVHDNGDGTFIVYSEDEITRLSGLIDPTAVTEIVVIFGTTLLSLFAFAYDCENLTKLEWHGASNITTLESAFRNCFLLETIPELNTSNVTNMKNMCRASSSLKNIPEYDYSNVTNLETAFNGCTSLVCMKGNIDFSSVVEFTDTFLNCPLLIAPAATGTDIRDNDNSLAGNWVNNDPCPIPPLLLDVLLTGGTLPVVTDTEGGTVTVTDNGDGTFSLTSPDVITKIGTISKKDATKVEIIKGETIIDASNLFTSFSLMTEFIWGGVCNVTNLSYTWNGCSGLTSFPAIDTSKVTNSDSTWSGCSGLISFPLIDLSSATNLYSTWNGCTGLTSFPAIDVPLATNLSSTWNGCTGLTTFPAIDTSSVIEMNFAWSGCIGLTSFNAIDTSSVTNLYDAWSGCTSLVSIAGPLDLQLATGLFGAFSGCALLTSPAATGTPVRATDDALAGLWAG